MSHTDKLVDQLGELLYECGWRPIADAQWQRLEAHIPQLRELLSDDEVSHGK